MSEGSDTWGSLEGNTCIIFLFLISILVRLPFKRLPCKKQSMSIGEKNLIYESVNRCLYEFNEKITA